ncbi:hypothetical protein ACJ73_00430 [Blastomyces percursus]|uniref:Uncharacterized protein n=1 Tax=Blastomyces percursus TaxID=1658174 RepID=A0A1J9QI62_9EURO|nr:hypothetical protein ACJ73_00430 [Blastomyces percursus]
MPIDRASWRNVRLYEASTGNFLGGTHINGSMIGANLLSILDGALLAVVDDHWSVKYRVSGVTIGPTNAASPCAWRIDIYSQTNRGTLDSLAIVYLVKWMHSVVVFTSAMGSVWYPVLWTLVLRRKRGLALKQLTYFRGPVKASGWRAITGGGLQTWTAQLESQAAIRSHIFSPNPFGLGGRTLDPVAVTHKTPTVSLMHYYVGIQTGSSNEHVRFASAAQFYTGISVVSQMKLIIVRTVKWECVHVRKQMMLLTSSSGATGTSRGDADITPRLLGKCCAA